MLAIKLGQSLPSNNAALINADTYSIQLTGTEYVTVDGVTNDVNVSQGSISLWTKQSSTSGNGVIFKMIADAENYMQIFYHNGTQQMRAIYEAGNVYRAAEMTTVIENDGAWHHLLMTWSVTATDKVNIWLDGVKQDQNTNLAGAWVGSLSVADIGQNTASGNFYKGFIDEFSIFDRVVDIGEVFIANRQPINVTGLSGVVGYWRFEEGTGAVASDSSGKANTGTLVNSPAWTTDTP
jgi:hypothetical protein